MSTPAIQVEDIRFLYGSRAALDGVSFQVGAGELFGLLGPNGGGKTTLFRILSTLLPPASGRARILGHDIIQEAAEVRRRIGVVFQSPSLDLKLTVAENLTHQGHLYGLKGRELKKRSGELLSKFDLSSRAGDRVETLSGGLRRRVELAKGLLHRPEVLLLDEPSSGLDPGARADLRGLLRDLVKEGITVVLTTHMMEEAESCDRLVLLNEGRIVALGRPEDLKSEVGGDVVWFEGKDPRELAKRIREAFQVEPKIVDGRIRVERDEGHEFLTQVIEALPGSIRSATLAQPTLEDVFFLKTGHFLADREKEAS